MEECFEDLSDFRPKPFEKGEVDAGHDTKRAPKIEIIFRMPFKYREIKETRLHLANPCSPAPNKN